MEWAILMADPGKRETIKDEKGLERDRAAVLLLEWCRLHISRG
jgi:hypothetical protein